MNYTPDNITLGPITPETFAAVSAAAYPVAIVIEPTVAATIASASGKPDVPAHVAAAMVVYGD
jgi:hypothetical protein